MLRFGKTRAAGRKERSLSRAAGCTDASEMERREMSKKTIAVHLSSNNHAFETDPNAFAEWSKKYGPFTLDAAASKKNALCEKYLTEKDDALSSAADWDRCVGKKGRIFVNPPYGRTLIRWVHNAAVQNVPVMMLTPARTDTAFFAHAATNGVIVLLEGRQQFYFKGRPCKIWNTKLGKYIKTKAPFPSMLVFFHPAFAELGDDERIYRCELPVRLLKIWRTR